MWKKEVRVRGKERSMRTGAWETREERGNKEKSKIFRKKVEKKERRRKKEPGKSRKCGEKKVVRKKPGVKEKGYMLQMDNNCICIEKKEG